MVIKEYSEKEIEQKKTNRLAWYSSDYKFYIDSSNFPDSERFCTDYWQLDTDDYNGEF